MTLFSTVFAQINNPVVTAGQGQDGTTFFAGFLSRAILLLVSVGGVAFFFMFLIGAIRWITSGGDKAQVESARAQITQSVAGLFVMFSIWAIASLLERVLGINLIDINLTQLLPES